MIHRTLALAAVSLSLLTASAYAADLTLPAEEVAVVDEAGFDWARPYVGASVSGEFSTDDSGDYFGGGVFAGVNFLASEGFLLGIEGSADIVTDGDVSYAELFVFGRAGVILTPNVLVYGIAGAGYEFDIDYPDANDTAYQLGAGIEVAVAEDITVRGQLTGYGYFEGDDLFDYARATVGVAFHF
ncbi:MAG: hypothetical protein JWQ89_2122 [Devosia sp.]|uniref:outer membrane beta-barrel protein n=1 Tax=Devosia sp. TaxID=1871048 RepID=UPI0026363800|nr:outer membrane beta-barrel protein [Devosia sp.]MDB5540395.1 hypothetical protein [Devosia sp.]